MSETDDWLKQMRVKTAARTGFALSEDPRAPDAVAEHLRIGQAVGVPPSVVAVEPGMFRKQAEAKAATALLADAPATAAWLQDATNGPLAKDDIPNLTWFERNSSVARSVGSGVRRIGTIPGYLGGTALATQAFDIGKTYDELLAEELAKLPQADPAGGGMVMDALRANAAEVARIRFDAIAGLTDADRAAKFTEAGALLGGAQKASDKIANMGGLGSKFRDTAFKDAPDTILGVLGAFAADPVGGMAFVAGTALESLPTLAAAALTTFATKSPAAGIAVMGGGSLLLESQAEAMEFLREKGVDVTAPDAAAQVMGNEALLKEAQRRGMTKGLVVALFDMASGGVAGQVLSRSPAGDVIAQGMAQAFFGGGGEAVSEVAIGEKPSAKQVILEAVAEMATSPVEVAGVAGRGFIRDAASAARGDDANVRLTEIDQRVAASKLATRAPETFREFLDAVGANEPLYVPADDLRTFFQAKDLTFEAGLEALGIDFVDANEALASGNKVAVPSSVYATRISGTEDAKWFHENASFGPEEMSVAEARRFNDEVRETLDAARAEAEEAQKAGLALRASDVQVHDNVYSQLRAAGRTADVADREARVWSAFFRTMAERYGDDALDLAQRFGFRIEGPDEQVGRRRGDLDVMLNTLRSKGAKALKPKGGSLVDFIRAAGGVRDTGGDVEAMDAPKGVIAETKAEADARKSQPSLLAPANPKGLGLDELGRAAIEAGFFPDLLGGRNVDDAGVEINTANLILDALSEELAGRPIYRDGDGPNADLTALAAELSRHGLDPATMTNDEIAAALESDDGALNQIVELTPEAPEALDAFVDDLKQRLGLEKLSMSAKGDDITLNMIVVPREMQGNGVGTEAMQAIAALADRHGKRILLSPDVAGSDNGTTSRARLVKFYKRFGFVENKGRGKDLSIGESMIREPRQTFNQSPIATDTPAFRAWFGDSKVVDADGKPLVVYHGTGGDVEAFDPARMGEATDAASAKRGFFFTADGRTASAYGYHAATDAKVAKLVRDAEAASAKGDEDRYDALIDEAEKLEAEMKADGGILRGQNVVPVYLAIQNPLVFDAKGEVPDGIPGGIEGLIAKAKRQGRDGVIIRNFDDAVGLSNAVADHFIAFSPTQIKSVFNRGTFDPADPRILHQPARASISFPAGGLEAGTTVIKLFETADLSSFLHESAHHFLEVFTALASDSASPQAMRYDLAAIRRYLGNDGGAYSVEQHETWARTGEAYFMSGVAPSLELADAFARFKAWLTRIYRSLAGLNVKISPEIRDVMDRMLATDAEIAAARETQRMSPLFTDQTAAGMSDAAWGTYQRMARRSSDQAAQTLLERTMAKVRREREKWFKDERAQVREEVEKSVNARREHRLVEMLANQRWIGKVDADVPDMQIDRKELVTAFGEGVLPELNRTRLGGKRAIYGENGASLHEVADFFGFSTPSEMIGVLQNTPKRKDAIDLETDRIMTERHGDPLNDGSIEEEALAAIHGEQQAQTVATELRHIAGKAGMPTRNLTATVFRARARAMLGRMSVAEASKPDLYLAAERRAAKGAEDAFARVAAGKDAEASLKMAARFKEQQLLNHYLYMEARDLKAEVDAGRERMRDYGKSSVRKKLEGGYIEQIDALLERYDFRVRSKKQIGRAESLRAFVERMKAAGREGELAIDDRLMDDAKKVHYTRLSVDELRGLFDTIDNIDHLGRFKQKLIDAKEARDHDEVVSGVLGAIDANVKGSPPGRTDAAGERGRKYFRDFLNLTLTADTLLREIDGFKDLGPTWAALKAGIDAGMNRVTERRVEMAKAFDAIYAGYSGAEKRAMSVRKHIPELGDVFSGWDLIALALNTGNVDNFERLTNPKTKGHFKAGDIEAALARLTRKDWETVQATWDYINSFWPEIAAKEKRQTGVAPKKVEPKVMVSVAPGFVTGGYYPIRYDSRLSGLTDDFQQKDLGESLIGGRFGKAQTRNGHTKERTKTSRQPVKVDLAIGHMHVDQVLYDLELGEAVAASWKVLQDPRVKAALIEKGKQSDFDALELWLQDVASGERIAVDGATRALRYLRTGFTVSRLAINISTALIQPSGIVQSAVVVGKAAVAKGMMRYLGSPVRWTRDVLAVSPMMRQRQATFQRDIYNAIGDLETGPMHGWAKFQRDVVLPLSFVLMQKVQFFTVDMPTWVAAYEKHLGETKDEAASRTYADAMVKRAQGSGLMADRGMMERGTTSKGVRQQEWPKLFTALGSYMFAKFNVAYEQTAKTDFRSPVQIMSLAADIALLFTLEAALYAAVKGGLPGEDDDDESWARWLGKQTGLSAMSTLPFVRDLGSVLAGFGGGSVIGSAWETLGRPFQQAAQGELDKAAVKAVVDAFGVLGHLPSSQTRAVIDGLLDDDLSLRDDPDPARMLGLGGGHGRSLADILFGD